MILDCESFEHAITSIARIFSASSEEIEEFLQSLTMDSLFEAQVSPGQAILQSTASTFGSPATISEICWFHATRVLPETSFDNGLLTFDQMLGSALGLVSKVAIGLGLSLPPDDVERKALSSSRFNHKRSSNVDQGPYGFLVKEVVLFRSKNGSAHHDYLEIPEIFDDICDGLFHGELIRAQLTELLQPCLVKFKSSKQTDSSFLSSALFYLLYSINSEKFDDNCCSAFDGDGDVIPSNQILDVHFNPQ